jgi:ubiquitin-like modifier-activating enzyme ATG7
MNQLKKLNYNNFLSMIDISVWHEIEKQKINVWKLEEKMIGLNGIIEHPFNLQYSKKHNSANIMNLSSESFLKKNNDNNDDFKNLNISFNFLNYNMEKDLINKSADFLNSQKDILIEKINNNINKSLFYGILHTHANLKTHVFKYNIDYPTLFIDSSPLYIQNKTSGEQCEHIFDSDFNNFIIKNKINTLEPFVFDTKNKKILQLSKDIINNLSNENVNDFIICMLDLSSNKNIGWHWNNLLTAIRINNINITKINLLAIRDSWKNSIYMTCTCNPLTKNDIDSIKIIGMNDNKIKTIDLSNNMDPVKIMESSSKLNLSLMKWRMSPNLKLDELADCKVLLLGSGTLGCNIARHLLMWGVNHITFVDRGTVSYSNPVRQTLFEFSDCIKDEKSKVKSIVAAEMIKRILPTCECKGIEMTIHMPGHRIDEDNIEKAKKEIKDLENLIIEHDITFLLTDTRESRWLPTLLATTHEKPIINVALGFDTFVVMRHGLKQQKDNRMGCYFCNDVVAPVDSLSGRTIDQQCTITRPGVSAIASSIAVEILASIFNHPEKFLCSHNDSNMPESEIGIIPQQIRGEINGYSNTIMHGYYYDRCVACSDIMVDKFRDEGYDFIIRCINENKYIEKTCKVGECSESFMDEIIDMD